MSNNEQEKGNILFGVLGFFFPIIGLILYIVWLNDKKADAKVAGIGALIGFILSIIVPILLFSTAFAGFKFLEEVPQFTERIEVEKKSNTHLKRSDFDNRETLDFKETLEAEGITPNANYKEIGDQITIYMFRGKDCGYCKQFLNFLNDNSDEYGKYFKLVSFEVWYNEFNKNLMDETSEFLNKPAEGVPYIIIGDKVFGGYAPSFDEDIKKAIVDEYNNTDRYDVFENMIEFGIIK